MLIESMPSGAVSPAQQYVNPDRHLTGGPSREKLSKHELDARIERARLNNQAIMKRRELVEKDKDQYSQITQKERQERKERARKAVETKKIQVSNPLKLFSFDDCLHFHPPFSQLAIDDEREKSRARKLEKLDKRDWDSEKAGQDGLWQSNYKAYSKEERPKPKQLVPWG